MTTRELKTALRNLGRVFCPQASLEAEIIRRRLLENTVGARQTKDAVAEAERILQAHRSSLR